MRETVLADIWSMFNTPDRKISEEFLHAAIQEYTVSAPRMPARLEENLSEGFTVFNYPLEHRKSVWRTNSLERIKREIRRRTRVVSVFRMELMSQIVFCFSYGDQ